MSVRRTLSSILGLGAVIALDYRLFHKAKQHSTENKVDEASEASFPASDPPAYTGTDIS